MIVKRYATIVLTATLTLLIVIASITLYVDPYWLWRENPIWLAGQNRILFTKTRFAKALQVLNRDPEVVVLGSSRVQAGIYTDSITTPLTYNMGIESLKAYEMRAYVNHLLRTTNIHTLVIGLDFFTFIKSDDDIGYVEGFDDTLGTYKFLPNNIFTATLSRSAIADTYRVWTERTQGYHNNTRLGHWKIADRPRGLIEELLGEMGEVSYSAPFNSTTLDYLEDIVILCQNHNVELKLFISPIHQEQEGIIANVGMAEAYDRWKQETAHLARKYKVMLWDFTQNNPYANSDLSQGSNPYYLDASHYRPLLGNAMLAQLGIGSGDDKRGTLAIGQQRSPF